MKTTRHINNNRAASLTGYGLVVGLIAILAIGAVSNVGDEVSGLFGVVDTELQTAGTGSGSGGGSGTGAASLSISPASQSGMNVTGPGTTVTGAAVIFTVTNTGSSATGALNAASLTTDSSDTGDTDNFEFTGGGDACDGVVLNGGETCLLEIRPLASGNGSYTGTISVSDGSLSTAAALSGAASGFVSNGYFVRSASVVTGSMGGLSGADSVCQADLRDNNWLGKDDVPGCTVSDCSIARAFLCTSATCNALQANTEYIFANAADPTAGGDSFTTDVNGDGPGNQEQWSVLTKFNATSNWRSNIGLIDDDRFNSDTPNITIAANVCNDWTNDSSGDSGPQGNPNGTFANRWFNNTAACNQNKFLICYIDP